jgi:hypothetical protein
MQRAARPQAPSPSAPRQALWAGPRTRRTRPQAPSRPRLPSGCPWLRLVWTEGVRTVAGAQLPRPPPRPPRWHGRQWREVSATGAPGKVVPPAPIAPLWTSSRCPWTRRLRRRGKPSWLKVREARTNPPSWTRRLQETAGWRGLGAISPSPCLRSSGLWVACAPPTGPCRTTPPSQKQASSA